MPILCAKSDNVTQICATLQEWENIPKQFDGATYHAEKSLYNILTHDIVPAVTGMLRVSKSSSTNVLFYCLKLV